MIGTKVEQDRTSITEGVMKMTALSLWVRHPRECFPVHFGSFYKLSHRDIQEIPRQYRYHSFRNSLEAGSGNGEQTFLPAVPRKGPESGDSYGERSSAAGSKGNRVIFDHVQLFLSEE